MIYLIVLSFLVLKIMSLVIIHKKDKKNKKVKKNNKVKKYI